MTARAASRESRDSAPRDSLKVELAFRIARKLVARRQARHSVDNAEAIDWPTYYRWRSRELEAQFHRHFGNDAVESRDILDFGCGDGSLSTVLGGLGARSVHGIDLDARALSQFAARLKRDPPRGRCRPTFSRSAVPHRIQLPDGSFDCICCFDVMEHVMDHRDIIREWHRVLRPGGRVLIWWQPYWHPFGHHAHDWVPIPWAHAFLDDEDFNEVCAKIVDWPGFRPSVWDRNPDGTRRNRFRMAGAGDGFLNKLTIHTFERECRDAGLALARRAFVPFSVPHPLRLVSALGTAIPRVRDFLTACAIYELVKAGNRDTGNTGWRLRGVDLS